MSESVIDILKSVGAILTDDHFVLTSGKHTDTYVNKDALYPHAEETSRICQMFAEKCKDMEIETVVAPALGGIILSQWTAYHLTKLKGKEVFGVYAEKTKDKDFTFSRGYDKLVTGKKVLVLEDTTVTGGSVKKVVDTVKAAGGEVVAVCVMVNRNPQEVTSETIGAPFYALGTLEVEAYDENEMPESLRQRPVNMKIGHGVRYVEVKN